MENDRPSEPTDFADRVAAMRDLLAGWPLRARDLSVGYVDQYAAATRDAQARIDKLEGHVIDRTADPISREEGPVDLDVMARLWVVLVESSICPHLRGSPTPGWHILEQRRIVCARCLRTAVRRVVPAGCCDLCQQPSAGFVDFAVQLGILVHVGAAGDCCAWPLDEGDVDG